MISIVLDSSTGKPAAGVLVNIQEYNEVHSFDLIGSSTTNFDGRCTDLLPARDSPDAKELKSGGWYKVTFKTKEYFEKTDRECFYPWVEITFVLENPDDHHHIPLLISPYSFTTYRGS